MLSLSIAGLVLLLSFPARAQCPPSKIAVSVLDDGTPGCIALVADLEQPELNITNNCDEDQFHIEAGVDCPNCGPPVTLRAGTFGSFIAETRALSAFSLDSPLESHDLSWAAGGNTGVVRIEVVPDIYLCPEPDAGTSAEQDMGLEEPPPPPDDTGCSSARGDLSVLALLVGFVTMLVRTRLR